MLLENGLKEFRKTLPIFAKREEILQAVDIRMT
jgi:hypothetical protein